MDLKELCDEYATEGKTGRIIFTSPFYSLLCKEIGIKYSDLSKLGKMILKSDAIDTFQMKPYNTDDHCFKDKEYYLSL